MYSRRVDGMLEAHYTRVVNVIHTRLRAMRERCVGFMPASPT